MTDRPDPGCPYPFGTADELDLHPRYASLREEEPVSRVQPPFGGPAWLVTRYEDVRQVLADPRFSRAAAVGWDVPRTRPSTPRATAMLAMDPPEHTRVRQVVAGAFTARSAEKWRAHTMQTAETLLERMSDRGCSGDLVQDLAVPLPMDLLLAIMGLSHVDRTWLQTTSEALVSAISRPEAERRAAKNDLADLVVAEMRRRKGTPPTDLLGDMVAAEDPEHGVTEAVLIDLAVTLMVGGWASTTCQLASFVYVLLTRPHLADSLRARQTPVATAVEELLRYTPVADAAEAARIATEDIEVAGALVRKGEAVFVALSSANRDSRAFDRPDEPDFGRTSPRHVAFGHGPHRCFGAEMARMELQIALTALLDRFPRLALAVPAHEIRWRGAGSALRGPVCLPVRW